MAWWEARRDPGLEFVMAPNSQLLAWSSVSMEVEKAARSLRRRAWMSPPGGKRAVSLRAAVSTMALVSLVA